MVLAPEQPPVTPTSIAQENELGTQNPNKGNNKTRLKIIGGVVATLTALGIAGGTVAVVNSQERAPEGNVDTNPGTPDDVIENPVVDGGEGTTDTPEGTSTDTETELIGGEELKKLFEVPAETTGEALAEAFIAGENRQIMYGVASQEAADAIKLGGQSKMQAEFERIADEAAPTIESATYTVDALANNENIQYYKQSRADTNGGSIALRFYTSDNTTGENQEPYKRSAEVTNFESSTVNEDGSETIVFTATTHENVALNRADELTGQSFDGQVRELTVTYVVEDGVKKVSDVQGGLVQ